MSFLDTYIMKDKIILNSNNKFDYFRYIPKGPKKQLHFHLDELNNYCAYLEPINNHNKSRNIYKQILSFNPILCSGNKGTIITGTCVNHKGIKLFFMEDVIYYKSTFIKSQNWDYKLNILQEIIQYLQIDEYIPNQLVLGTLITRNTIHDLICVSVPYKIYSIEYLYENKKIYIKQQNNKTNEQKYQTFFVKAHEKPDIYMLYTQNEIGYAYVPNYKTSIMLNNIFRRIPENENLDVLEESDDDEYFEDTKEYKHVDKNKTHRFKCVYNMDFKMWTPLEIVCE